MRVVILDNLRSAWNVGSIFRTAAALNYTEVALCGVCITPPSKKLTETSRGMEDVVAWKYFVKTEEAFRHYRQLGFQLIALESGCGAQSIEQYTPMENVAWILGNEAKGMDESILAQVDQMVELPLLSQQASINVACAFSATAYVDYLKGSPP
jgi:23S rRNA (guanosine2251-2'-O)-methyltransferase